MARRYSLDEAREAILDSSDVEESDLSASCSEYEPDAEQQDSHSDHFESSSDSEQEDLQIKQLLQLDFQILPVLTTQYRYYQYGPMSHLGSSRI